MLYHTLLDAVNEIDPSAQEIFFDKLNVKFFIRLGINLCSVFFLIRLIYYPLYKDKEFFFTFFMFNIIIFILTYILNKVDMSTGAAFGLFAVFSLLRYRTENITPKDMTYLFTVIAMGLIASVMKGTYFETALVELIVIAAVYALDSNLFLQKEIIKNIQYENIDMIKPEHHSALLEDLKKRTGLKIHKISIGKVDFLRDTAIIKIYYYEDKSNASRNGSMDSAPVQDND